MRRERIIRRAAGRGAAIALGLTCCTQPARAQITEETYAMTGGVAELRFDARQLAELGLSVADGAPAVEWDLAATADEFRLVTLEGELSRVLGGTIAAVGEPWVVVGGRGLGVQVSTLRLTYDPFGVGESDFILHDPRVSAEALFTLPEPDFVVRGRDGVVDAVADVVVSSRLAALLEMPEISGRAVGRLVINASVQLVETLVVGLEGAESAVLHVRDGGPAAAGGGSSGADVIVGSVINCQQFGRVGTVPDGTVGLAIGTTSCNRGSIPLNWFALPNTDHPVIPQNLYRLRTVSGADRMEQIGLSWMKHASTALQQNFCAFGCTSSGTGTLLGVGCSDPYSASLNASNCALGPRSGVHPWTGLMAGGVALGQGGGCNFNYPAKNHIGHLHDGISHRIQVLDADLMPDLNVGARYFGEGMYITPHEFVSGNGNQLNNASYREHTVTGPSVNGLFTFGNVGDTHREEPAIHAWPGASRRVIQPAPDQDGIAILAFKTTDLGDGTWHYEYALYNLNLDRSIRSFSVPLGAGAEISNVEFFAPRQHAPEANAENYATTPWDASLEDGVLTWSTETVTQNPLANALRFATLYNFRFDADTPPRSVLATVGFFKTEDVLGGIQIGAPMAASPAMLPNDGGVSFAVRSFGGYVDPRMESTNAVDVDLGLTQVTMHFSQPVEHLDGGPLGAASFEVRETGGGVPPNVSTVSSPDQRIVTVTLDRIITLGEWTTIRALVRSVGGILITNLGDLGPGVAEPDRIDIAYLPDDVDGNGRVEPLDLLRFRQILGGSFVPHSGVAADYIDTDRNGMVTPVDLLRFRQLLVGAGMSTQPWAGIMLANPQP